MLGRMAEGVAERRDASLDRGRLAGTAVVVPPPPFLSAPPKLFLADGSGVFGGPPVPSEAAVVITNPTSTQQKAATTSPAATAAPFSRHRPAWEAARHAGGLGLAGALNAGDNAVPHAATVLTAQSLRTPASLAAHRSARTHLSSPQGRWWLMSPREEMAEASEDYTRVIARGGTPNPRTTHIFDDRVVVVDGCESSFLRWCHGCSKDLGLGKDIFMYRGEMAFCSHECRYREMLLFDEES